MTATPSTPQNAAAGPVAKTALYLRVSTGRQADSDLSIPDQRRQITSYCAAKGWDITAEFVEPGNTATDDRRPAFQAMIDAALVKPPGFAIIIVHSFSAISFSSSSMCESSPRTACGSSRSRRISVMIR
jgi:site-specific DNA recombinase